MSQHYNRDHTKEHIEDILQEIQDCVRQNKYTIAKNDNNRQENLEFIQEYNLKSKKQHKILLQIKLEDFCYSLKNLKSGYEHETLYVFCPCVTLFNIDNENIPVKIYIKFNILETKIGNRVVVISFHKLNKPINYLFR